eukprot:NODE_5174_length_1800_cov_13.518231.p1 GENE.NODE_5174_length_1800_cov_13.518231~~NODE_5174_length_1800_cov_13.518231.p1  ORF type:complete len:513 (+),score=134.83 NODE_5174_length_1800_cov_13.518231:96-1634(+)
MGCIGSAQRKDPLARSMQIMVPEGAVAGTKLRVTSPDGQTFEAIVPNGLAVGQAFSMQYRLKAPPSRLDKAKDKVMEKATQVTLAVSDKTAEEVLNSVKDTLLTNTAEWRSKFVSEVDAALAGHDNDALNSYLDSAFAAQIMGDKAPDVLRKAGHAVAVRHLKDAIESRDAKQLKGALVAARRLNAIHLPEFIAAAEQYKALKMIPSNWDVSKMAIHRSGSKMVAKADNTDPAFLATMQQLLDSTRRKVYTRDRLGQAVPERLEVVKVTTVMNEDLWADLMARREHIRREVEADRNDFVAYPPATLSGDGCAAIAMKLADEFAEPLMPEVNEAFLYHGTSGLAADKITTEDFRVNLAGTNCGTLYGRGVYFAEHSTKSDEYTRADQQGHRHLLICRVVLGRVYYTDQQESDSRACEAACLKGRFHAVLGDRIKCRGTFREFVVFDEEQVYPNYIVTYKRIPGTHNPKRSFQVKVPPATIPGTVIEVNAPDGHMIHVLVPQGVKPGGQFPAQF